jgi:hypothetical protein
VALVGNGKARCKVRSIDAVVRFEVGGCRERKRAEKAAKTQAAHQKRAQADAAEQARGVQEELRRWQQAEAAAAAEAEVERMAQRMREEMARDKQKRQQQQQQPGRENVPPQFTSAAKMHADTSAMPGWFQQHNKRQSEKERYDGFLQKMESLKV